MAETVQCPTCLTWHDPTVGTCTKCGSSVSRAADPAGTPTVDRVIVEPQRDETEPGTLRPGSVIGGRYRVLEQVGRGGMGVVYRVEDLEVQETLALKVLAPHIADRADMIQRFKGEMKLSRQIAHPRVCKIYDLGEADGQYFITMQYVDGDSLASLLQRVGPVRGTKIRQWLGQLCEGLAAAHRQGIVHRDLKPANVMVDREGNAVIMDFGLAVSQGSTRRDATPGGVQGTPGYMAPEQARGEAGDARTDIYSLGCLLYELLSGGAPFAGDTIPELIALHREGKHRTLKTDQQIDADLERIANKCLRLEPGARFGSISEVQAVLDRGFAAAELADTEISHLRGGKVTAWLGAAALLAVVAAGPLLRGTMLDEEIRIEFPREAALSKAREIVRGMGYSVEATESEVQLTLTDASRRLIYRIAGSDGLRGAVRDGEILQWTVGLTDPDGRDDTLEPGEYTVRVGLDGKLHDFETRAREDFAADRISPPEARQIASLALQDFLPLQLSGFDEEVVPRGFPPGVSEVTWRNPRDVLGHREEVRVDLQGSQVFRMRRALLAPQEWDQAPSPVRDYARKFWFGAGIVIGAVVFAMYVGCVVYVFRGNRWSELRRGPAVATSLVFSGAVLLYILSQSGGLSDPQDVFLNIFAGVVASAFCFGISLVCFAGLICWLGNMNPRRVLDLRLLSQGRIFEIPAASALVHGVLTGLLLTGVSGLAAAVASKLPGYLPEFGTAYTVLDSASPMLRGLVSPVLSSMFTATWVAASVEFVESVLQRRWLLTIVALGSSILAAAPSTMVDAPAGAVALQSILAFAASVVQVLVLIQLYRRFGVATVFIATAAQLFSRLALELFALGHPAINHVAMLAVIFLVASLAAGLWGLFRPTQQRTPAAADATA